MKEENNEKKTIGDEIDIMIDAKINQLLFPQKCTINRVYSDGEHIDVKINDDVISYLKFVGGTPVVNHIAVLVYCDGDFNDMIVIVWKQVTKKRNSMKGVRTDIIAKKYWTFVLIYIKEIIGVL